MENATRFDEMLSFLQKYNSFYQSFLELETEKYVSISKDQLKELDEFVKQEQVFLLKSRGFEQEREAIMEAAGCKNMKFRVLLKEVPAEKEPAFRRVYEEMTEVLGNLKQVNTQSTLLTQARLRKIEEATTKLAPKEPQAGDYSKEAKKDRQRLHLITKKV